MECDPHSGVVYSWGQPNSSEVLLLYPLCLGSGRSLELVWEEKNGRFVIRWRVRSTLRGELLHYAKYKGQSWLSRTLWAGVDACGRIHDTVSFQTSRFDSSPTTPTDLPIDMASAYTITGNYWGLMTTEKERSGGNFPAKQKGTSGD